MSRRVDLVFCFVCLGYQSFKTSLLVAFYYYFNYNHRVSLKFIGKSRSRVRCHETMSQGGSCARLRAESSCWPLGQQVARIAQSRIHFRLGFHPPRTSAFLFLRHHLVKSRSPGSYC